MILPLKTRIKSIKENHKREFKPSDSGLYEDKRQKIVNQRANSMVNRLNPKKTTSGKPLYQIAKQNSKNTEENLTFEEYLELKKNPRRVPHKDNLVPNSKGNGDFIFKKGQDGVVSRTGKHRQPSKPNEGQDINTKQVQSSVQKRRILNMRDMRVSQRVGEEVEEENIMESIYNNDPNELPKSVILSSAVHSFPIKQVIGGPRIVTPLTPPDLTPPALTPPALTPPAFPLAALIPGPVELPPAPAASLPIGSEGSSNSKQSKQELLRAALLSQMAEKEVRRQQSAERRIREEQLEEARVQRELEQQARALEAEKSREKLKETQREIREAEMREKLELWKRGAAKKEHGNSNQTGAELDPAQKKQEVEEDADVEDEINRGGEGNELYGNESYYESESREYMGSPPTQDNYYQPPLPQQQLRKSKTEQNNYYGNHNGNVVVKKEVLHSLLSENDDLKKEADKNNVILDFLSNVLEKKQMRGMNSGSKGPFISRNASERIDNQKPNIKVTGYPEFFQMNPLLNTNPSKQKTFRIHTPVNHYPKTSLPKYRNDKMDIFSLVGDSPGSFGEYNSHNPHNPHNPHKFPSSDMMNGFKDLNSFEPIPHFDEQLELRESHEINPMYIGDSMLDKEPHREMLRSNTLSKTILPPVFNRDDIRSRKQQYKSELASRLSQLHPTNPTASSSKITQMISRLTTPYP